jgi:chromosomal replication initiator protein
MSNITKHIIDKINKDRVGISYWAWPGKPDIVVKPSFESVIAVVSEVFDLSVEQIISKTRKRNIVIARQMVCLICRELTDLSYKYIGLIIGGRDHSTVIHAVNTMRDLVNLNSKEGECINPELRAKYDAIKKHFKK